jgi:hypothetical protein
VALSPSATGVAASAPVTAWPAIIQDTNPLAPSPPK